MGGVARKRELCIAVVSYTSGQSIWISWPYFVSVSLLSCVYSSENLALGQPTWQTGSALYPGESSADKAVDGNVTADIDDKNCAQVTVLNIDVFMSQIVLYLLHSTSVLLFLSFYIDVVFTLSTGYFYVFVDFFADRPKKILSCIIPINQDGALDSLQLSQQHRYDRVKATFVNEIKTNSHQCLLGAMICQSLHMGHKYTPILGCGHRHTLLRQFNFCMLCPVLILSDSTFLSIDFNAKYF